MKKSAAILALAVPCALLPTSAATPLTTYALNNGTIAVRATDAIGGRLLSFSLAGKANFLKTDEQAGDPAAPVDATTPNIGYMGHEMWVGPQSQWWLHQSVNPARAAEKASWPPDAYLSLARYSVKRADAKSIEFDSPASPVSGLQLNKRFALVDGKPNSLQLDVSAVNRRDQSVAWDIWFNTRTDGNTWAYVPVANAGDVRQTVVGGFDGAPITYTIDGGILSLDRLAPPPGQHVRQGKLLIQPSQGWLAGFHGDQAFIIQFDHQAKSAIHPEQGQVELFNDYRPEQPAQGLLEMEVHAPYVKLAPGAAMRSHELWTILAYTGAATRSAHIAFLRQHATTLGLRGL